MGRKNRKTKGAPGKNTVDNTELSKSGESAKPRVDDKTD